MPTVANAWPLAISPSQPRAAGRSATVLSLRTAAVSAAVARRFVLLKAVPHDKCVVVPNAVDLGEFAPCEARRAQTRTAMNAEHGFIWLAVGRVAPSKDYPNLLAAFAKVRAVRQDALLWIAGQATARAASALQALAARLNIANSVRWLARRS
jgi:glycosyltransferase involved in cell wall biosynthesis